MRFWKQLIWTVLACLVTASAARAQGLARKILPNDILAIRVVNEPDLTLDLRVGADGKITYPFLGELVVEGKTLSEVEGLIRTDLDRDYIVNPQVSVQFREYVKQFVSVVGQVNAPGRIELLPYRRMDVVEAIAAARDLTRNANSSGIELNRRGQVYKFTYDDLKKNSDPDKKFYLEPDDVIEVKERIF